MPTDKRQRQRENSRARQEAIQAAQKRSARRRQIVTTIVAIAGIVGILWVGGLIGGGDDEKSPADNAASATTTTAVDTGPKCTPRDGRKVEFDAPPPMSIDTAKTYTATVKTDVGTFKVELDDERAPNTANNFVFLARNKFYDCVTFHRVIPGFMIQGGDPEGTGSGGPGYQFNDEIPDGHKYEIGQIVMANSGPNTQGSQFFIVTGPQGESLPPSYSPFGKVVDGLDVVKKIEADGNADPQSNGVPPKKLHKMITVDITES